MLAQQPDNADALNLSGVVACQLGQYEKAGDLISRAIILRPNAPEPYNNLANALRSLGRFEEAIAAYQKATALRPNYADAHYNLGIALNQTGARDAAIEAFRQTIAVDPNHAEAYSHLAALFENSGKGEEVIALYRKAIAAGSKLPATFLRLGKALMEEGELEQAIEVYRESIAVNPDSADVHSSLGVALMDKSEVDEATACFRTAIALDANHGDSRCNLGIALRLKGRYEEALETYAEAMKIDPHSAETHNNYANILRDLGRQEEPIVAYRQALSLKEGFAAAHSNLLMTLHYHPTIPAESIAEEHRSWNRQHAEGLAKFIQSHANDRDLERPLRIGYVSPDFREHAVAPMSFPLIANHDRDQFKLFCYAQLQKPDAMTDRFRAHADQWFNTAGISDERLAARIRLDKIDILVDLAGHTAGNRLLMFARKPAPIQVSRQGYPNTTGLTAIDYRMTDALADPPGLSDTLHSEKLIRLPRTNWIYQPPASSPSPDHPPAVRGAITFGCFNTFAKITEPMLTLWARILAATPGSRFLLKALVLDHRPTQERLQRLFAAEGIDPSRLELRGHEAAHGSHLELYNRVDIALDPFPYHGTTTTCEAFWMGVPVITLAGQTHVARVGVSLLTNMNLTELIAADPESYLKIAVDLANDPTRLQYLHQTLRRRLERSPIMDAARFAREVELAYRTMWRTWCEQPFAAT